MVKKIVIIFLIVEINFIFSLDKGYETQIFEALEKSVLYIEQSLYLDEKYCENDLSSKNSVLQYLNPCLTYSRSMMRVEQRWRPQLLLPHPLKS